MNEQATAIIIIGVMILILLVVIGYMFPSTAGTVANITSTSNYCQNCDSGIKSITSNFNVLIIAVLSAVFIIALVAVIKHYA